MKKTIDIKNKSVTFSISSTLYPKDIIYKACYAFIDRAYILLDDPQKNTVKVTLRWKEGFNKKKADSLEGEFENELLSCLVRENVAKQNKKIIEQIVGGAMASSLGLRENGNQMAGDMRNIEKRTEDEEKEAKEIEDAVEALKRELAEIESGEDYENDELGIREIVAMETISEIPKGKDKRKTKIVNKKKGHGKNKKK